jgi:hypothetical protein
MTKFGCDREEGGNRKICSSEIDLADRTGKSCRLKSISLVELLFSPVVISWKVARYAYLVEEVQDEGDFVEFSSG